MMIWLGLEQNCGVLHKSLLFMKVIVKHWYVRMVFIDPKILSSDFVGGWYSGNFLPANTASSAA